MPGCGGSGGQGPTFKPHHLLAQGLGRGARRVCRQAHRLLQRQRHQLLDLRGEGVARVVVVVVVVVGSAWAASGSSSQARCTTGQGGGGSRAHARA
jgi:hypothetical protein